MSRCGYQFFAIILLGKVSVPLYFHMTFCGNLENTSVNICRISLGRVDMDATVPREKYITPCSALSIKFKIS